MPKNAPQPTDSSPWESKLTQLYASLSNLERKHFAAFVASPFFNRKSELVQLQNLIRQAQSSEQEMPSKTTLFQALYPGRPYHDQTFRLLSSELLDLLNRFLAYQSFQSQGDLQEILLLRNLGQRNLDKHFQYTLRKVRKHQGKGGPKDPDHHLNRYLLEEELGRYLRRNPRSPENNLRATVEQLDVFYLVQKLKTACSIFNNRNVVDLEHEILFLESIITHLDQHAYPHEPLVMIYYRALQMFLEPDVKSHFQELKVLLQNHRDQIPESEARDAYTFAQNHCIRQINRGQPAYMQELFQIYQKLLEQELIFEGGILSPWHYKNIVVLGLRLEAWNWVESFIENYRERIRPEFRDNAYTYNLAKLKFYLGDYTSVKRLLLRVEYEDLFYNLDSKVMLLKIYLEQGEHEALESLTTTFITYLDRNKMVSEDHRQRYRNLVRYVRKLILIGEDRTKLERLRAEMEAEGKIADVAWLREVLQERLHA